MVKAYIDRIEEDKAVMLLGEDFKKVNFPVEYLPDDLGEGDYVLIDVKRDEAGLLGYAAEIGAEDVSINYAYGNQFYGDADITAAMDTWYAGGTEIVFACGGGIYSSAGEAAAKVDGKVIGVDTDQAPIIDGAYGEGMTVTSAMKGLAATVKTMLTAVSDGSFEGGKVENLGLVSEVPDENFVQLAGSTQFGDGFSEADYEALVADMLSGKVTVSNDTDASAADFATVITVNDQGNIK